MSASQLSTSKRWHTFQAGKPMCGTLTSRTSRWTYGQHQAPTCKTCQRIAESRAPQSPPKRNDTARRALARACTRERFRDLLRAIGRSCLPLPSFGPVDVGAGDPNWWTFDAIAKATP